MQFVAFKTLTNFSLTVLTFLVFVYIVCVTKISQANPG